MMESKRYGSPTFYKLLEKMAQIHSDKSHDYASNQNPYGNYKFAGMMSKIFDNPDDAGFIGRIAEKIYRLANLENNQKDPVNETIEDTETDICVIVALWIASRRDRRKAEIHEAGWLDKPKLEDDILMNMNTAEVKLKRQCLAMLAHAPTLTKDGWTEACQLQIGHSGVHEGLQTRWN